MKARGLDWWPAPLCAGIRPERRPSRQARRLAGGLARLGVGCGDRVATLLPNGIPFCLAVFAVAELGAVLVPLNTKLRRAELAFMLANSAAGVLLPGPAVYLQY